MDIIEYIKVIPDDMKPGKEYKVKCVCGGVLKCKRSTYNGHLHACCNKCKFVLHE